MRITYNDTAERERSHGNFFLERVVYRVRLLGFEIIDQPANHPPTHILVALRDLSFFRKQGCAGGGGTALRRRADSDSMQSRR